MSVQLHPAWGNLDPRESGIDAECVALCEALNRLPGIRTIESCCGHGKTPFHVWFLADSLDSLPPALYFFDSCHCGFAGWKVLATTDCGMNPVHFCAEGPIAAYEQAAKIAEMISKYAESEPC